MAYQVRYLMPAITMRGKAVKPAQYLYLRRTVFTADRSQAQSYKSASDAQVAIDRASDVRPSGPWSACEIIKQVAP